MTPPPSDNSDPRDYILDLSSTSPPLSDDPLSSQIGNRHSALGNSVNSLSIHFRCCRIYAPIYRNAAATAYAGHCPKCHRPTRIAISPSGDPGRIFTAQ